MSNPQPEAAQQCIFCKIIKGEIQSFKVYEDALSMAVLDINPGTQGHMLLLPKEHHQVMPNMPEELIAHMGQVAKWLSHTAKKVFASDGIDIFTATGGKAGQNAPHVIIHIIPRYENDKTELNLKLTKMSTEQLTKIKQALAQKIKEQLGFEQKAPEVKPKQEEQKYKPEQEEPKKEEYQKPREKEEDSDNPKKEGDSVDLDDIASLLGGGK